MSLSGVMPVPRAKSLLTHRAFAAAGAYARALRRHMVTALFAQAAHEAWGHAVDTSKKPARPDVKSTSVMNKGD